MLAHMEATPPNIFALRGKALPESWSAEKRESEMLIPEWLFTMVYRCLEKKPESRFASGMALHEFVIKNSVFFVKGETSGQLRLLQQENRKLLEENRNLQNELQQFRSGKITVAAYQNASGENVIIQRKKSSAPKVFLWILAGLFVAAIFIYAIQLNNKNNVINNNAKNVLSDSFLHVTTEQQQQLNNARDLLKANSKDAALDIYQELSQQGIAQAMFQYANLALQGKNERLDCNEAFEMLTKASDKNYLPAKTTLGFLYAFANDEATLKQLSYYNRCVFPLNITKGADLLMQSTVQGDVTAEQWLSKLDEK
jgi:TPR repeat protein